MPLTMAAVGTETLLQTGVELGGSTRIEWTRTALLGILSYGLLAGIGALVLAFGYRALTVRQLPTGPAVLLGLALPTGWLTSEAVRHGTVLADSPLIHYTTGSYLLGVLFAGTIVAAGGHRLGDHLACGTYGITRVDASGPVADLVRAAGLSAVVTLPESIDDAEGYPAVGEAVKRDLEGCLFRLPSQLSVPELESRVERRLETDFDVGYANAVVADDGNVSALSVGGRRAGISPTLGPAQVAVAISGDPSPQASTGDPVEIWTDSDASSRLVATGTLRACAGSVTTIAVDADDADAFEPGEQYRLTTRPEAGSDAHALVSAIQSGDETVTATRIEADSPLENEFVGWIPGTVLVIERDGDVLSLPADNEPIEAGDTLYVFGTPETLTTGLESPSGVEISDSPETGE